MSYFSVLGAGITIAMLSQLLKSAKWDYGNLVSLAGTILLLAWLIVPISEIISYVENIGVDSSAIYLENVIKALGISIVTKLSVDSCNDMGESAIGGKLEMCGRVAVISMITPLITDVIEIVLSGVGI